MTTLNIIKTNCPHCGAPHDIYVQPTRATPITKNGIRLQLAAAHEAMGAALALLHSQQVDAAAIVLDDALKGKK